jgi:RHS repeat-associated protein
VTTNAATGKPYQFHSATQPSTGPNITGTNARAGAVAVTYDRAGFAINIDLGSRPATFPCVPAGAACGYRVDLSFDEVGRLQWAKRWSYASSAYALSLYYQYDASDERVSKVSVDNVGNTRDTEYVFGSLELHRTTYNTTTGVYGLKDTSNANLIYEVPYLEAHGVRLGRLAYDSTAGPDQPHFTGAGSGRLHVFFELGDHLGSTSAVLDKDTGELVELGTYQPYGATESDYRPDRWKGFREDYRFTGKEEDIEVGLEYFGKRYLSPYLGVWVSADPLAVHGAGKGELNLYAYVHGGVLRSTDGTGLCSNDVNSSDACPPPPQDQGTPMDAPYHAQAFIGGIAVTTGKQTADRAAALQQWRETSDKRAVAHGILGFVGMRDSLLPLPPHPVLSLSQNNSLQQETDATFNNGIDSASRFNAQLLDTTVRVETTAMLVVPGQLVLRAPLLTGALAGGVIGLGFSAATTTSTGFNYVRDLQTSFANGYVGGLVAGGAGNIAAPAEDAFKLTVPRFTARVAANFSGGLAGYAVEKGEGGGQFQLHMGVLAGATSAIGSEVAPTVGGGDITSGMLGGSLGKASEFFGTPPTPTSNDLNGYTGDF